MSTLTHKTPSFTKVFYGRSFSGWPSIRASSPLALAQHTGTSTNTKASDGSQHTDTSMNTKAWPGSQHTDTSMNTKAWAGSQHPNTSMNT